MPHDVAERLHGSADVGSGQHGADDCVLVVVVADERLYALEETDHGVAPCVGAQRLQRIGREPRQLAVQPGNGCLRGDMIGDLAERTWIGAQRPAHGRTEHRVGERLAVDEHVGSEKLGEAQRRHEGDVDEPSPAVTPHGERPSCGEAGEVGRHDDRDRSQRARSLGAID